MSTARHTYQELAIAAEEDGYPVDMVEVQQALLEIDQLRELRSIMYRAYYQGGLDGRSALARHFAEWERMAVKR